MTSPLTPITSDDSKWVHLYAAGRNTACGRAVNVDRWTVRARRLVKDNEWCGRCWDLVTR